MPKPKLRKAEITRTRCVDAEFKFGTVGAVAVDKTATLAVNFTGGV
jgi:isoaspartyl peptidase/L-asparaginase-like protein (Ntn-hydrolase superfamily)